jgi:flagellar hook-associated protein 3 FlgL
LANTKDAAGQPLFGGFYTQGPAFSEGLDGRVTYQGDLGQHKVEVSDSTQLSTGVDGLTAFMRIESDEGPISVFEVLRGLSQALESASSLKTSAAFEATGGVRLSVLAGRTPMQQAFTLSGTLGSAQISAQIIDGSPAALMTAINAQTAATGITATVNATDGSLVLSDRDNGTISIKDYEVTGQKTAEAQLRGALTLTPLDANGSDAGPSQTLADADQSISTSIGLLSTASSHVSIQRAKVGAYANAAQVQKSNLEEQSLFVQKTKSEIADADMAELITKLQTLLLNRDATQQAFAKISQQSLFDFLR